MKSMLAVTTRGNSSEVTAAALQAAVLMPLQPSWQVASPAHGMQEFGFWRPLWPHCVSGPQRPPQGESEVEM